MAAILLGAGCFALAVACVGLGAAWSQEKSRAEDLQAEVAAFEERDAARQEEDDARPDLRQAARDIDESSTSVYFSGDEDSLTVETKFNLDWVEALLDELGFPSATIDRMGQTRALDGTLTAEGDNVTATWTYHPDDGLNIVFSVDD